ncbi:MULTISPECIES: inovirus-type Gp2 protein [Acinetobacter]|uniref:YagK/YfjJ domain-containing protein n=1 Tax=Acinetobacter TaxID=469 RepID=UPI00141BB9A5|nr:MULTISPECIES: inovirus-type Gp2 protein [Acinetobacter]MCS4298902.1 hypothetical protein [Acinetobacter guillouiae]MCW2252360.1 hypothetical protein [Acinetobacter sp. BIGb0204]NII38053.1 hypothetical protein [Acinetobacter sp. BIGb0196]
MSTAVNESKTLIKIEFFVEGIVDRRRVPRNFYIELSDLLIEFGAIYNPEFHYSALIQAFIELLLDMEEYLASRKRLIKRLSEIPFLDIQGDFKKHNHRHKRQLSNHRYSELQNTQQLVERMENVIDQYSRILVVRVDLAYPLKHQGQVGIQEFNDDMSELRKKIHDRDTIFKGLIEYAWALEQGEKKGYHCHLLLVYKGYQRRKAYGIAQQVGKLWRKITNGLGCDFNCHDAEYLKQFSDRNTLGIGMIHRRNQDEVNNMLNTVKYLVRPEKDNQYLRVKCKKRMRTFG